MLPAPRFRAAPMLANKAFNLVAQSQDTDRGDNSDEGDHNSILDHRRALFIFPERFDLLVQHHDLENDRIHFEPPFVVIDLNCSNAPSLSNRLALTGA